MVGPLPHSFFFKIGREGQNSRAFNYLSSPVFSPLPNHTSPENLSGGLGYQVRKGGWAPRRKERSLTEDPNFCLSAPHCSSYKSHQSTAPLVSDTLGLVCRADLHSLGGGSVCSCPFPGEATVSQAKGIGMVEQGRDC